MGSEIAAQAAPTAVAVSPARLSVSEVLANVQLVQQVMREVMKPDVHFGIIPGTDKPTLLKPGAELLCMVFRIAPSYRIEDLSAGQDVRYRVTASGTHQSTGIRMGDGMGEASSGEAKYKWRKAFDDEFEATPPDLRRIKTGKYTQKQVRTEPADLANTILKMACKRALSAMTLNVTAASDMFTQDLEDMDEKLAQHLAGEESQAPAQQRAAEPKFYTEAEFTEFSPVWVERMRKAGKTAEELGQFLRGKGTALTADQVKALQALHDKAEPAAEADNGPTDATIKREGLTYAQVIERMDAATTPQEVEDAQRLGLHLPEDQRKELQAHGDTLVNPFGEMNPK